MLSQEKIKLGTLIQVNNNGPYTRDKYRYKYLLVNKIVYDKINPRDPGFYNDVYYHNKETKKLELYNEKDVFVGFTWLINLNRFKNEPVIIDQLGEESLKATELPFKYEQSED